MNFRCRFLSLDDLGDLGENLPIWCNPQWMNQISELYQIKPCILVCEMNEQPAGYLPMYEKSRYLLRKIYSPVLAYYNPLIFHLEEKKCPNRNLLLEKEMSQQIGKYLRKNYSAVSLNLQPRYMDVRGFSAAGYRIDVLYTYLINLEKEIIFFKNEMTSLRKAQKAGYRFGEGFSPEAALTLIYGVYQRKRHPFDADKAKLLKTIENLYQANLMRQYNLYAKDKIISSIFLLLNGQNVYAWLMGTEASALKNGAAIMLFWDLFHHLQDKYKTLDLCGGNSTGPSRVKAAVGAELMPFYRVHYSRFEMFKRG